MVLVQLQQTNWFGRPARVWLGPCSVAAEQAACQVVKSTERLQAIMTFITTERPLYRSACLSNPLKLSVTKFNCNAAVAELMILKWMLNALAQEQHLSH